MRVLLELLKLDFLSTRSWFAKQTASKMIVAILYLLVLGGVGMGIFLWSSVFFKYLLTSETFGEQTSQYVIKAAILVLTWIGVLSTLISTLTFLLTPDKNTDLLITFPIPDIIISLRTTVRSLFVGFVLFLVSVFPLVFAHTLALPGSGLVTSLIYSLGILFLILFFSHFVGSLLGYLSAILLRQKYGLFMSLLFGLFMLLSTWYLLRLVFPPELRQLSDISAMDYPTFFGNLPLIKAFRLDSQSFLIATITTLVLSLVSLVLQNALFLPSWQIAKVHLSTLKKSPPLSFHSVSLVGKDLLSIIRNPRDLSYLFFLLSMIMAFFGLFGRGYLVNSIPERFRVDALALSFAWLVFFSGTYLIRLVYPLMVNEGQSRWWFFTLPVFSYKLLISKLSVSLFISLPLLAIAVLEWSLLPFAVSAPFLIVLSLMAILLLAVLFPLIGAIYPEYTLAFDPDRASTSFTGLIAVILVFIIGLLGGWLISRTLGGRLSPELALNGFLTFCAISTVCTAVLALEHTERYTVDV